MNKVYDAVRQSPNWDKTLLIINYDEWGGFFDHVVPPVGPISDAERTITTTTQYGPGDGRLGFRVPCLLIGPRARRNHVEHLVFEPNSILDFIRWNFEITDTLSARSDQVNNLAYALDFVNPPNTLDKPAFTVAAGPFAKPCNSVAMSPTAWKARQEHLAEWNGLLELSRKTRAIA